MYLNFSKFRGQTSAGGGGEQALVQKWGQVSDGGIGKKTLAVTGLSFKPCNDSLPTTQSIISFSYVLEQILKGVNCL